MSEWRLFEADTVPECATVDWYAQRDRAPHLEQEGHAQRLVQTAAAVFEAVIAMAPSDTVTVVDLGAGDGGLLSLIQQHPRVDCWGYDLQPSNIKGAIERGVDVTLTDFDDDIRWADIVVISEVLEHLVDPHGMLRRIHDSGARYLVATSPYTETADSHYEHHLWAWDLDGYRTMIEAAGWRVISTDTAWISQIVLAERA